MKSQLRFSGDGQRGFFFFGVYVIGGLWEERKREKRNPECGDSGRIFAEGIGGEMNGRVGKGRM